MVGGWFAVCFVCFDLHLQLIDSWWSARIRFVCIGTVGLLGCVISLFLIGCFVCVFVVLFCYFVDCIVCLRFAGLLLFVWIFVVFCVGWTLVVGDCTRGVVYLLGSLRSFVWVLFLVGLVGLNVLFWFT